MGQFRQVKLERNNVRMSCISISVHSYLFKFLLIAQLILATLF